MFYHLRFTEIFVNELEDTADLNTLVMDYLKGLSPNATIVDGIVRFVIPFIWTISCFSYTYCISQGWTYCRTDGDRSPKQTNILYPILNPNKNTRSRVDWGMWTILTSLSSVGNKSGFLSQFNRTFISSPSLGWGLTNLASVLLWTSISGCNLK